MSSFLRTISHSALVSRDSVHWLKVSIAMGASGAFCVSAIAQDAIPISPTTEKTAVVTEVAASASSPKTQPIVPDMAYMRRLALRSNRTKTGEVALGLLPTGDSIYSRSARIRVVPATRAVRPSRLLLTQYLPPIGDQGGKGSCVAWATAYYCYTYGVARNRKWTPEQIADASRQFSPAFIYNIGPHAPDERGGGMAIGDAFATLRDVGCATLDQMPYSDKDSNTKPDETAQAKAARYRARKVAFLFKGGGLGTMPDIEALKVYLAETKEPFVMGIPIFSDFPQYRSPLPADTVYKPTFELTKENIGKNFNGFHAITVVGYDDSIRAFRIANSWSDQWGDKGFLWIDQDFVRQCAIDGWAKIPGGPVTRETPAFGAKKERAVTADSRGFLPNQVSARIFVDEPKLVETKTSEAKKG
ncbi:MAG TPA: C1 family peptidase [Abditibacterium sp.]